MFLYKRWVKIIAKVVNIDIKASMLFFNIRVIYKTYCVHVHLSIIIILENVGEYVMR